MVKSSNIRSVGYDAATKTLEVEFQGGNVYQHEDVPQDLADRLVRAESVGRFYNQNVKGTFEAKRIGA